MFTLMAWVIKKGIFCPLCIDFPFVMERHLFSACKNIYPHLAHALSFIPSPFFCLRLIFWWFEALLWTAWVLPALGEIRKPPFLLWSSVSLQLLSHIAIEFSHQNSEENLHLLPPFAFPSINSSTSSFQSACRPSSLLELLLLWFLSSPNCQLK